MVRFDDDGGLERHLRQVQQSKQEAQGLGGIFERIGGKIKGVFAIAGGAALIGTLGTITRRLFDVSTAAEETESKFRTVFGAAADGVDAFIEDFGRIAGLTRTEGREVTATLGAMARGMGLTGEASAQMAQDVVRLAGDLASFNNVPVEETLRAIQSGLIGEQEPLRRYGILLSAAVVDQKALEMTGKGAASALTEQEKVLARLRIAYEQAGVQVGDLERTQSSTTNTFRQTQRDARQLVEDFSRGLVPAYGEVISAGRRLLDAFRAQSDSIGGAFASSIVRAVEYIVDMATEAGRTAQAVLSLAGALDLLGQTGSAGGLLGRWFDQQLDNLRAFNALTQGSIGLLYDFQAAYRDLRADVQDALGMNEAAERNRRLADEARASAEAVREQLRQQRAADREAERARERRRQDLQAYQAQVREAESAGGGSGTGSLTAEQRRTIEAARERLRTIERELKVRAEMHKESADALREIYRLEDQVARLREDAAVLGKEAVADALAASEAQLAAAREHYEVVKRTAAVAPFEARSMAPESVDLDLGQDLILDLETLDGSLNALRENLARVKEAYDAATDPGARAALKALIDAHERQIKATEGVQEGAKEAGQALEDMAASGRALVRLADAIGLISDELSNLIGGALDAVDAMGRLSATRDRLRVDGVGLGTTAGLFAQLPSFIGAAAGVASAVAGLFGVIARDGQRRREELEEQRRMVREQNEAMRELAETIRESARAVGRQLYELTRQDIVGGGFTGGEVDVAQRTVRGLRTAQSADDVRGSLQQLVDMGFVSEEIIALFDRLLEQAGGDVGAAVDQLFIRSGLEWSINRLAQQFAGFGDTLDGVLKEIELRMRFEGLDPAGAIQLFIDRMNEFGIFLGTDLEKMLNERLAGIDPTSPEGRAAIKALLEELSAAFGTNPALFEGMSPRDMERFMAFLEELAHGTGASSPDGELTRSVQIARSITEIQANELVAIGEEQLYTLRTMSSLTAEAVQTLHAVLQAIGRGSRGVDPLINPRPDPVGTVDVRTGAALSNLMAAIAAVQAQRPVPQVLQSLSQAQQSTLVNVGGIRVDVAARDLTEEQIRQVERAVGETLRRRARDPFNPTLR